MSFAAPAASGGDKLAERDVLGHLLIVRPVEYVEQITTAFGDKDAVRVSVVDLDATDPDTGQPGHRFDDVLWFGGRLVGSLKRQLGDTILGRMAQGTLKPGATGKPPYELSDATSDPSAVARAEAWIAANPRFTAPASTSPAPAPAASAAPAPAAVPEALLAQLGPGQRALYEKLAAQG
ncbi:hypothetical protein Lfu02_80400 [Longispora fulva]|uniref:Uncharacterized protein n=1 Tax=Longispora fulva TaxID=619741 RepID=A0A8J7KPA3_9ACTN|nr:hypothetical protein [Longispora fulva]MBG6140665.1 hypothetical protein [Longispora fulva]MBG6141111.1 hypothetical protein [Longispora fulva]GIG63668.1 hypothetical protein Lfu02_80400 [Longispora fulva]